LGFAGTALAGALFPYRAKEVYEGSPGAKFKVNSYLGMFLGLVGAFSFVWTGWVLAPDAFGSMPFLMWLTRIACVVGALLFLWLFRKQMPAWLKGEPMPWPTALGLLGGGLGQAMVLAFLLSPELGVLGNWNFENFPSGLWAQIIAFGLILFCVIWYALTKRAQKARGINIDYAFKEIPPE